MADDEGGKDTLRQFVENECKAQALRPPGTNSDDTALDAERMNRFYQRALNESERMNNEVTKSQKQRSELHKELSKDMLESWTQDHAQQVLCPQTYELWSKEEEKAKKVLQELEKASINDDESSDDASH